MIWSLDGQAPEVHPTAWIALGAQVVGRVRIGPGASVWFGAVLRGDNEWIDLGEGSNVQENAVLHTDWGHPLTIGAHCTIGHKAMLHGARIGEAVLVGMAATILNGAVIGDESLVGAAALVTEGKAFEARTLLIGAPARPSGRIDDAGAARLRASAEGYAANARHFARGLVALGEGGPVPPSGLG